MALSTDDKKAIFLVAVRELDGNVSRACEAATISRTTFYNWLDDDETFAVAVRTIQLELDDQVLDDAEEVIKVWLRHKLDKDVAKWILSKKGTSRGYGNKVTVEHQGDAFRGMSYPAEPESVEAWQGDDATKPPQG